MSTLIFDFHIGDEDGPYYIIYLVPYNPTCESSISNTFVVNLNDISFDCEGCQYVKVPFNDNTFILKLFSQHNIVNIIEIHDWYDFLNESEVLEKQKYINDLYNRNFPISNDLISIIVIIPYNQDPVKYVIPFGSPEHDHILNSVNIFEKDDMYYEKQNLVNTMRKYIIQTSLYNIFKSYTQKCLYLAIIRCDMVDENNINF